MSTALARTAHDVRARALSWLHTHRRLNTLRAGADGELDQQSKDAYKSLLETALAASLTLRDGTAGRRESALARELLDYCWDEYHHGAYLYERLLRHPVNIDTLETYAHFARAGYHHPGLEKLIAHSAAMGVADIVEYVPNRRLAVANALRVTGHDRTTPPEWDTLARATWLGHTPQPWHIDWMTGYAVTHTVFHLTDWGRLPERLPDDMTDYLTRWLPVWTDIWAEVCQWDLMGELLIIDACLPEPRAELADWERLAALQHPDGLVPRDDQPVDDDPTTRFHEHQHPTVVAAIAGTITLGRTLTTPAAEQADLHA